jgi:tetratricopeptide (TPR) repeat protein
MRALSPSSVFLLLLLALLPSLASAESGPKPYPSCDREPTSADISGAKGAYEAGQASFNEADYARAILYWEDAFRRDCTAAKLLLNLARAYELSSKKEHAILALETYLERRPDASDRPSIEKRIENLRAQVASEAKPVPIEPAPAAVVATAATPTEPKKVEPVAEEKAKSKRPVWPVVMTISGAVVAGVGVGFMMDAASTLASVNCSDVGGVMTCDANPSVPTNETEETARANNAVTQRTIGALTFAVGTGFLAAGAAAWYFSWKDRRRETATHVLPMLAPGYAGLSVRGRF